MKKITLFSICLICSLSIASDVFAQERERRRRPGQSIERPQQETQREQTRSEQSQSTQTETRENETQGLESPETPLEEEVISTPPSSGRINPQSRGIGRQRNPVSIVPRPRMEDYSAVSSVPVEDRWRIVDALYKDNLFDPYNRNYLKGDKPLYDDWFFSFTGISDTITEVRSVPTPVGSSSTDDAGNINIFGSGDQMSLSQNILLEFVYYKGNTTFKPPDWEVRVIPVINYNFVELDEVQGVNPNPGNGLTRRAKHIAFQAAFVDKHLRNVSDNYDFDSLRVGIQPFTNDFRGFLFIDSPVGVRLFGTRANNTFQYNVGLFRRLEKDTNSGLNDAGESLRDDDIFALNLIWQDTFVKGLFTQFSLMYNRNDESDETYFDNNNFIARPASLGLEKLRDYDVTYLGFAMDGHMGRLNLTSQYYYAIGKQSNSVFRDAETDIRAHFFALEPSIDLDWLRLRASLIYASGDDDPFDDVDTGFDAIFENPQMAGADNSYWIRQAVPLVGGGRVTLSGRNSILNSLRSSKEQGQSNFSNPGLQLVGVGFDADVTPKLRISANVNAISFDDSTVIGIARNQGNIDERIGTDASLSLIYRPLNSQNIVLRTSYARLISSDGFDSLFPDQTPDYFFFNLLLQY